MNNLSLKKYRSIWSWLLAAFLIMSSSYALAAGQVTGSKRTTVKDHRYMESHVTVYKNGEMVMSTNSWSKKHHGGLKGHSAFFVCVDNSGNAIWVSKPYKMTTIGGTWDPGTPSDHTDVDRETAPAAIGKYTSSVDIYHDAGNISQSRDAQVAAVKKAVREAGNIAKEVKDAVATALK